MPHWVDKKGSYRAAHDRAMERAMDELVGEDWKTIRLALIKARHSLRIHGRTHAAEATTAVATAMLTHWTDMADLAGHTGRQAADTP